MSDIKLKIFVFIIAAIVIAAGLLWFFGKDRVPVSGIYDQFARCLAAKKITMYGAEWCSHCQSEKKAFGSSFQFVPYVECPDNPQLCLEKGISAYPTWIFSDGRKFVGEQGLENLSRESGCSLLTSGL